MSICYPKFCSVSEPLSAPHTPSCGASLALILDAILISLYVNDLRLNISKAHVDVNYVNADDQSSITVYWANAWVDQYHIEPNITINIRFHMILLINIFSMAPTRSCDMQIYSLWNLT